MIQAKTIDAMSTSGFWPRIEAFYPLQVLIHVFLDNARYHHAKIVQESPAQPRWRIKVARHRGVLPTSAPDRATLGRDAQTLGFLRDRISTKMGTIPRFGQRQRSRHIAQEFSGHDANAVYLTWFCTKFCVGGTTAVPPQSVLARRHLIDIGRQASLTKCGPHVSPA